MSHVFKQQGLLTIKLDTGYDLSLATVHKIFYQKPDKTTGEWTATVNGTELVYEVQNTDIDQKGTWKFQSYIEAGGRKGYGEIVSHNFLNPIK